MIVQIVFVLCETKRENPLKWLRKMTNILWATFVRLDCNICCTLWTSSSVCSFYVR